jgi:hypothetical protein
MENKETFVMFRSNIDVIKKLPTDAEKLEMLYAIANYSMTGIIPQFKSLTCELIFISIRPNIDGVNKRYTASVENGKKGGAPKGNSNAKKQPETTKNNLTEPETTKNNLYVSVSVSDDVYVSDDVSDDVYEDVSDDVYVYEHDDVLIKDVCKIINIKECRSDLNTIKGKILFQNGNIDDKINSITGFYEDLFGKTPMSVQDVKNKLNQLQLN